MARTQRTAVAPHHAVPAEAHKPTDLLGEALAAFIASIADSDADKATAVATAERLAAFLRERAATAGLILFAEAAAQTPAEPMWEAGVDDALRVRVTGPSKGRRRAGQHFTDEPQELNITREQLAVLKADPLLSVAQL